MTAAEKHMVKYGSYELESLDSEEEELSRGGSGDFMKLKVGRNKVRFLPPLPGQRSPMRVVWEHHINLPTGEFRNFACPRVMAKKQCIICRKADKLKTTGNPADFERAKKLFPKVRVYSNVIDRADEEYGPKILAFGKKIKEQLDEIRKDEDVGGDFTNPDEGFDIVINRKGTQLDTKYNVLPSKTSNLGDMDWIEQQHGLDRFAAILSEKQIREKLSAEDSGGGKSGYDGASDAKDKGNSSTVVDADFEEVKKDEEDDDDLPF